MIRAREAPEGHDVQASVRVAGVQRRYLIRQFVGQPDLCAVRRRLQERREARLVRRADVQGDCALGLRVALRIWSDPEDVHPRHLLAGHERQGAVRREPDLGRPIDGGKVHPDGVHGCTSAGLDDGLDVQDRDPVLAAYGYPHLFAVPREGGFVRLATHQNAAGEPLGARGRVGQGVGSISDDFLREGIDQIEIARSATCGGQELPVRRGDHAVNVNRAVIERLVNHRRVGGHHAAGDETEGRARIFVEAGQVDGGVHGIALRIDDADGVGILVGDEDAIVRLDRAASRGLRGGKSRACGHGKRAERCGLQNRASGNVHLPLLGVRFMLRVCCGCSPSGSMSAPVS